MGRGARHFQFTAQELAAGSPAYRKSSESPNPNGNRAQRRAWARLTKAKPVPPCPHCGELDCPGCGGEEAS